TPVFHDSNGDGMGDLEGVRRRLEYLEWLGVDAVWLTPFHPSPMTDLGYDIVDHTGVAAHAGTHDDFARVVEEAHRRGMRVILDLVPNHTSDQHPWFIESASSRASARRRWYIWADPAPGGGPPSNWQSDLGGSAWVFHQPTGQYYYHAFARDQPDLNWREPAVRAAMFDVMRFWLDRGVDGFRVDVLWHLAKDARLRDNPPNPDFNPANDSPCQEIMQIYSADQPDVHDIVAELRHVVDEYDDRLLIGEVYLPVSDLVRYYGAERSEVHLPFNFQLVQAAWDAPHVRRVVDEYEASVAAREWPNWVLGNHDQPRVASRIGSRQARVAAMMLFTLRGTPTLYYGDEIGMENAAIPREEMRDERARSCDGKGIGRDPFRTPMRWDEVARQTEDPGSMLSLHRRLIELRRRSPALLAGEYRPVDLRGPVFAYLRVQGDQAFLVALNLNDLPRTIALPPGIGGGRVEISTRDHRGGRATGERIDLAADEGLVIRLDRAPPARTSTMT
ncbi:MAG TPA: alpha-amylase family glycosyl hydrolase, partial [Kofleriaceae bacterium]|nr:alpha-amylase family glycosyl hydrolase [Kofleriaceae bacterium]